jgi:hypothetical protein
MSNARHDLMDERIRIVTVRHNQVVCSLVRKRAKHAIIVPQRTPEAVSTPGRDIVKEVASKGRLSGKSHEQKESRYELNQTDSEDRGGAVPGEGKVDTELI